MVERGISRWECEKDGWMKSLASSRMIETSLGTAVVVTRLGALDEDPTILATGRPVLHEAELARFAAMAPAEKKEKWEERAELIDQYRALKAANPRMTVDSPWN